MHGRMRLYSWSPVVVLEPGMAGPLADCATAPIDLVGRHTWLYVLIGADQPRRRAHAAVVGLVGVCAHDHARELWMLMCTHVRITRTPPPTRVPSRHRIGRENARGARALEEPSRPRAAKPETCERPRGRTRGMRNGIGTPHRRTTCC